MAIYSAVPPPEQAAAQGVPVAMNALSFADAGAILDPTARVTLSIPLDAKVAAVGANAKAKEPMRRDSMKRRDALLRGKEGSRRRQRWENDHLLHVPNAQPPLPSDWEVHPTYPVHTVPYYLAPLWESSVKHRAEAIAAEKLQTKTKKANETGRVPAELRQKLKKAKGAKSLLQDLEEEVRRFVLEWEKGVEVEMDSEDEEIVFVGRNGGMSDYQRECVEEELEREKLVWESGVEDQGASFGRWLVHSIAAYYGLSSRSVTVGNPARREAYVGIKTLKTGRPLSTELPRPLWGMI